MYQREQPEFKQALHPASTSELAARMWNHLDQLLAQDGDATSTGEVL